MASAAAAPLTEEEARRQILANPGYYLDAFNCLKKLAARDIMDSPGYQSRRDHNIEALQAFAMPLKFMTWYYDNDPKSKCPIGQKGNDDDFTYDFTGFKNLKRVPAMELVQKRNDLTHAFKCGGRKKRSRTNRRSRIRRQKRRTSRRY